MTTWRIIQRATTPLHPVLIGYLVGSFKELDAKLRAAMPGYGIIVTSQKPYSRMPPPAAPLSDLDQAAELVGAPHSARILMGWSAGCGTVRNFLLSGAKPEAVITLDGTTGNWPTLVPGQLEVWQDLAEKAKSNQCLWVATATQQSYTEKVKPTPKEPNNFPFWWTRHLLEKVSGVDLPPGTEHRNGGLHLISYPSNTIDRVAHERQLRDVFPSLCARVVVPWLEDKKPFVVPPINVVKPSAAQEKVGWGQAVLDAAEFYLAMDIHEQGHNSGSRLEHYFLEPLKLPKGSMYCAAAVVACIRQASERLRENPVGSGSPGAKATAVPFRKAGLVIDQDKKYTGKPLIDAFKPGCLIIKDRSKKGPGESGYAGHIGVGVSLVPGTTKAIVIEANADRVRDANGEVEAMCKSEWELADPDVLMICLWPS